MGKVKSASAREARTRWQEWLTDDRLSRWNHLRERAGVPAAPKDAAVEYLVSLDQRRDSDGRQTLKSVIERIG